MYSFQENPGYTYRLDFPLSVLLMSNLKADMSTCPPQNMMLISFFCQLLLVIRYHILLGGLKMGDEVLYQSGMGAIFFGYGEDGDFILDEIH